VAGRLGLRPAGICRRKETRQMPSPREVSNIENREMLRIESCISFHCIRYRPGVFNRYAGIKAINHHQAAFTASKCLYFLSNQVIYLLRAAESGDLLAVYIQVYAEPALEIRCFNRRR
jgi:hypothetical protein